MRLYKEKYFKIYLTFLSMLLSLAFSIAVNNALTLNIPVSILVLISIIFATLIYLLDKNKKNIITYLIIFATLVIIGIVLWRNDIELHQWIKGLVNWFKSYNENIELYNIYFALGIVVIINLLGTIVFYIIMKKPFTKVMLAVILFVALFFLAIKQIDQTKLVVGIVIFYILNILIEMVMTIYNSKFDNKDIKGGILYLIPVCFILTLMALILPSKAEPIQWTVVKNVYNSIKKQIEIMEVNRDFLFKSGRNEFAISFTGYSDGDSKLFNGLLNKDDRVALIINKKNIDNGVYLSGSYKENYTGYSWEKNEDLASYGKSEYILDYAELIYAISRQEQSIIEENLFIRPSNISIKYNLIKTKSFFYPIKATSIRIHSNTDEPETKFANMTFPGPVSKGTSYRVNYCKMNLNGEAFQEMLRESDDFSYNSDKIFDYSILKWIEKNIVNVNQAPIVSEENLTESLRQRARDNNQNYLQLPDTLPDRVKDLAFEITKEQDNSYDKLKAIEKYLHSYTYTLNPQPVPEGQDFVDFFLFDSKEGYCTSFATSMCVLARCIDIPTRYVQGFIVDRGSTDENGDYIVKNSQAHAWTEAYIEGVGWIPFEATSSNYENRYITWQENHHKNNDESSFYEDYYRNKNKHNYEEFEFPNQEDEEIKKNKSVKKIITIFVIVFSIIIVLFIFLLIYFYWLKLRYKKRLQKADLNKKMYLIFTNILWRLNKEGYKLNSNETILDYADRINKIYTYEEISFLDLAYIFMKYRYGNLNITKEEYEQVVTYKEGLTQYQKEKRKKFKNFIDGFAYLYWVLSGK